jgi:hypothetical protein
MRHSHPSSLLLEELVGASEWVGVAFSWWVVEDSSDGFLCLHSLFLVLLGFSEDLFSAGELLAFVVAEVVVFEESADSESDLGLSPVLEILVLDGLEGSGAVLDDSLDELLVLSLRPVLTLLHVEVLQVQGAVWEDDVLLNQALPHLNDVLPLLGVQLIVH